MDLKIYIADAEKRETMIISSTSSKFSAARIKREDIVKYSAALDKTGLYFLLVGTGSVYVGESGLDSIGKRIMNTHSGTIDRSWHTVIGFPFSDTISKNELYYLENSLCEYVYANYGHCLTTTPAKENCNAHYRESHYHLTVIEVNACKKYFEELKVFIKNFYPSIFPEYIEGPLIYPHAPETVKEFYFKSAARDSSGIAEIQIHCGHSGKRKTVLKAGSIVSKEISPSFASCASVTARRRSLEEQGKLIGRILQEDITFDSQSGAGQFLNGKSFDGNTNWKTTDDNTPLKQLLV